jgi:hypothetical protein
MKPKTPDCEDPQGDLFRIELESIVDPDHALVRLAGRVDWARLEEVFGALYCADNGAPGRSTRLMVALHYLKFTFDLSDEDVVAGWVENPYWQYLSGMKYFEHRRPIDPSSMTHWRQRVGAAGTEAMPGNPYDGHTLAATLAQVERLAARTPEQAFVDQGYRGHDYVGPIQVHVDRKRRGSLARRLWRWMKRRAAIEPGIGHLKGTSKNANLQPSLRDLLLFFPDFPPLSWRAESTRPSGTEFLEVP